MQLFPEEYHSEIPTIIWSALHLVTVSIVALQWTDFVRRSLVDQESSFLVTWRLFRAGCGFGCKHIMSLCNLIRLLTPVSLGAPLWIIWFGVGWNQCYSRSACGFGYCKCYCFDLEYAANTRFSRNFPLHNDIWLWLAPTCYSISVWIYKDTVSFGYVDRKSRWFDNHLILHLL